MSGGLFALLDDIAMLAKAAATSLDDVALGAGKAAAKSAAVVIDDAAVSPKYVVGLSPKRELPVVWKITLGSLRNKFLLIIPAAMILSWLAPWVLPYLLIIGGSYLVYEGAEKVLSWLKIAKAHTEAKLSAKSEEELEKKMVSAAVRTDLILSTEIMLISLAAVDESNWIKKLLMLFVIAVGMTVAVYGVVAILVKLDDFGIYLTEKSTSLGSKIGLGIVKVMPAIFNGLTIIGTLAMLWVGGHLVWVSLGDVGINFFSSSLVFVHELFNSFGPVLTWIGETLASVIFGLILGSLYFYAVKSISKLF